MGAIDLPALLEENDWLTEIAEPDFFGDVRIVAVGSGGDLLRLVFNDYGKLAGGYLTETSGRNWHTERVTDVAKWIHNLSGPIDA